MVTRCLYGLLLLALIGGNITSWLLGNGIRVSVLDISVILFVAYFFISSANRVQAMKAYFRLFGPFITIAVVSLLLQLNRFAGSEIALASLYLWRFVVYSLVLVTIAFSNVRNWALTGLWLCGLAISILGLIQYLIYPNLRNLSYLGWDPHQFRVFSTQLDPNFTGVILVLTLILSTHFINHKNMRWRIFVITASLLSLLALLLTYSRGSFVAMLVSAALWSVYRKKFRTYIWVSLIFLTLLLFLPKPSGEGVNLQRTISVASRIKNNQEAMSLIKNSPILGVGFNTLRFFRSETQIVSGSTDVSHSGAGFHNGWLFLLVTTGTIGTLAYLWIWWNILGRDISTVSSSPLQELVFLSFVAVAIHSLFDNSLFYPWTMLWLWILVGVKKSSTIRI